MKIAGIFPGYGSQFVGMTKDLYDNHRVVQEYFEEASSCLNDNFVRLCFAAADVELSRMEVAYPSLFLVSTAIARVLQQEGVVFDAVAGYNQGEYSAVAAIGGLSLPDGLYLLSKYATVYRRLLEHERLRIIRVEGLANGELEQLCSAASNDDERVYFSMYYSDTVHYVGGHTPAIERLCVVLAGKQDVAVTEAPVEMGLHSPTMREVCQEYAPSLEKVDCKDLSAPLIDGISIDGISTCHEVKYLLVNHIDGVMDWGRVVERLANYDILIQMGPGTALADELRTVYPDKEIIAVNNQEDVDTVKQLLNLSTEENDD